MDAFFKTEFGSLRLGDSLEWLSSCPDNTVDLIVTSPPYALILKKEYGNQTSEDWLKWFGPFAEQALRVLKPSGSFVVNVGGTWNKGTPTRSLYHYKLLDLCVEKVGFFLAQDLFYFSPCKMPAPAEWVTIRRIRLKDAVEPIWWFSKTEFPKSCNRRVLVPYSKAMNNLLKKGFHKVLSPSGHFKSAAFGNNNEASISPNLLIFANTDSNSHYLKRCRENGIRIHPARFPAELPEFFIRMLTDESDLVVDPFAGSCVVGEVCERLKRRFVCCEMSEEYLKGAVFRFEDRQIEPRKVRQSYSIANPAAIWKEQTKDTLREDGGREWKSKRAIS